MSGASDSQAASRSWAWNRRLIAALLLVWVAVTFVVPFFAPDLYFKWRGWPFSFWMAAQGSLLVYLAIVAVYGWAMNRRDRQQSVQHLQATQSVAHYD